jgi:hypothetical protein
MVSRYIEIYINNKIIYMMWLRNSGIILLRGLKGAMLLDYSKDMSVHVTAWIS